MSSPPREFSFAEELTHAISHGIGVVLSVGALGWMLWLSIDAGDPWRIVASGVYGTTLILLFLASTLYHALYRSPRRQVWKLLDHCAIYLLIAGTYTPFLLVAMRDALGWWLFGAIWTLAGLGILGKVWLRYRYPKLAVASYLAMGWLIVLAAPQVASSVGSGGMVWIVAGGLSYTVGIVFYALRQLSFSHAVWHLFVLGGGVCHALAVALHVLPRTAPV
ncbi:MAG: hemolysin III family protein [Thermoanaerobaculia bacterium]|nr:hemolysin III family protein [Thermoanaerobaculia bacterium]